jgi:Peptidase family S41/N-terminal domain of Peptidase_S41 in eukaryotic IRBP
MTHHKLMFFVVATIALATVGDVAGRQAPPSGDATIDAATRAKVIDGALAQLQTAYVFPEVAQKMKDAINARVARREYDSVVSARSFADLLTKHLQEVSNDKHLRVLYFEEPMPERRSPTPEERVSRLAEERRMNFYIDRAERLDGNIGYLELRGFSGSPEAGDTATAAMNFLAGTDALIIDLRRNGGGSPAMIGLISSYLFDDVVHLNDFYWRESNETRQFWTSPHVQGRRYGGSKPVFVLTSSRTFSAAEEFTYNLKVLKRATIVGETTGGGAHPGGPRRITEHFGIWVPAGRAINPVTKTNWEGTGIEPDIKVEAPLALQTAQVEALKKVRASVSDARHRDQLDRAIAELQKASGTEAVKK